MTEISENSLKQRIRNLAYKKRKTPAQLWRNLVSERFLVRLIRSKYKDNFILKGGLLLSKYIEIDRETLDIDFLVNKLRNEKENLKNIFEEIVHIDVQDGFVFEDIQINELEHFHMKYFGYRLFIPGCFGKVKFKIQIDLGVGDVVHSKQSIFPLMGDLKGSLFENEIEIVCYPKEFIFAEKLETIISRGVLNSRMKDFHDLYSLVLDNELNESDLRNVLNIVFKHRKTNLNLQILNELKRNETTNGFWKNYHKKLLNKNKIPENIEIVICKIERGLTNIVPVK
jgi:predicted nucleotidyltransferase component of viral defense system